MEPKIWRLGSRGVHHHSPTNAAYRLGCFLFRRERKGRSYIFRNIIIKILPCYYKKTSQILVIRKFYTVYNQTFMNGPIEWRAFLCLEFSIASCTISLPFHWATQVWGGGGGERGGSYLEGVYTSKNNQWHRFFDPINFFQIIHIKNSIRQRL